MRKKGLAFICRLVCLWLTYDALDETKMVLANAPQVSTPAYSCFPDAWQRQPEYATPYCHEKTCPEPRAVVKFVYWAIHFPGDNWAQTVDANGTGECNAQNPSKCWPLFLQPRIADREWQQSVVDQLMTASSSNCSECMVRNGRTYRKTPLGSCSLTGGGGSGGGGQIACYPSTPYYQCFTNSSGSSSYCAGYMSYGPCCCRPTPIVIDISRPWDWAPNGGNGYHFTNVPSGVRFDLDGDGVKEQTAWPTATSENAWLVLDRNGNGVIDSGKELFGNFTDQTGPYGEPVAPGQGNGWQALASFDRRDYLGGNQDQIITRADAVFANLRLWVDRNHNGISEPNELLTLESIGITKIDYNYQETDWSDPFGNNFRYKAKFIWGDLGEEPYVEWHKDAWDVFPQWAL